MNMRIIRPLYFFTCICSFYNIKYVNTCSLTIEVISYYSAISKAFVYENLIYLIFHTRYFVLENTFSIECYGNNIKRVSFYFVISRESRFMLESGCACIDTRMHVRVIMYVSSAMHNVIKKQKDPFKTIASQLSRL